MTPDTDPVAGVKGEAGVSPSPGHADPTDRDAEPIDDGAEPAPVSGPAGAPAGGLASGAWPVPQDGERASYLADVSRQLWPDPARVYTSRDHGGLVTQPADRPRAASQGDAALQPPALHAASDFIVLPGLERPRLLVPIGRRAAGSAVRRYGKPGSLKTRLGTRGLSVMLRSGIGGVVLRDRLWVEAPAGTSTIESYLTAELGLDIVISLYLGSARANRKPILQLLTPHGDTLGYAKVGVNPLTKDLVRAERDALTQLDSAVMASLTVPRVLHYGSWQDLTVVVLSPLPVWERRSSMGTGQLARAMNEVAGVAGISRGPLAASGYWRLLGERLGAADDSEDRSALIEAIGTVESRAGDAVLSFGACHGDWAPWNMLSTSGGLLVWDWERFSMGVPMGFDAVHHWLQVRLKSGQRDPLAAAGDVVKRAASLLSPLGVEADEAVVTATVYLADLAARYLVDRQAEAGARLGGPGRWLIPALAARAAQL